jgi:serine/threonine protein kinase
MVFRVVTQVLTALAHIHQSGVVHCDLACRNILCDSADCFYIADFGLAGILSPDKAGHTPASTQLPVGIMVTIAHATRSHCHFS